MRPGKRGKKTESPITAAIKMTEVTEKAAANLTEMSQKKTAIITETAITAVITAETEITETVPKTAAEAEPAAT